MAHMSWHNVPNLKGFKFIPDYDGEIEIQLDGTGSALQNPVIKLNSPFGIKNPFQVLASLREAVDEAFEYFLNELEED